MEDEMTWTAFIQIALGAWSVVVATPGLIAFWWQWKDRREKLMERAPFVEILPADDGGQSLGWARVRIRLRNDTEIPVEVTEVKVLRPRGVLFAMPYPPKSGQKGLDPARTGSTVSVSWKVLPHVVQTGSATFSAQTIGFFGSTISSRSSGTAMRLSIRLKYIPQSASRTARTIKVTSEPIEIPHVKMESAS